MILIYLGGQIYSSPGEVGYLKTFAKGTYPHGEGQD